MNYTNMFFTNEEARNTISLESCLALDLFFHIYNNDLFKDMNRGKLEEIIQDCLNAASLLLDDEEEQE